MATVLERLGEQLGSGADDSAYGRALRTLAAALPTDRRVEVTDEVIRAAATGDVVLLRCLLAPEEPATKAELVELRELDEHPELRERVGSAEIERDLRAR
ncbi:MAG: hypothetical protein ACREM2_09675 [Vulcanimicrobiaceae bacterium]